MAADAVAGSKIYPGKWCGLPGIGAGFTAGYEHQCDCSQFDREHRAQPQLQFSIIDPALSRYEIVHLFSLVQLKRGAMVVDFAEKILPFNVIITNRRIIAGLK